jgi:hypothetical protein
VQLARRSITADRPALPDKPVPLHQGKPRVEHLSADIVKEHIGMLRQRGLELFRKVVGLVVDSLVGTQRLYIVALRTAI